MQSSIKAVIVTCIDFRIQTTIDNWIARNGYLNNHDRISIAGCSKTAVKPDQEFLRQTLLNQLSTSIKLHSPAEIILMDHEDCGAFKVDHTILLTTTKSAEKATHTKFLHAAKDIIQDKFPNITIRTYYVYLDGTVEQVS